MNIIKNMLAFLGNIEAVDVLMATVCVLIWLIALCLALGIAIGGTYVLVFIFVESWLGIIEQIDRLS